MNKYYKFRSGKCKEKAMDIENLCHKTVIENFSNLGRNTNISLGSPQPPLQVDMTRTDSHGCTLKCKTPKI